MAKTVTIPADVSRMEITINNKTYVYQGGATVSVPNEVAALIENNAANKPGGTRPASEPLNAAGLYAGDDYIAVYTRPDGTLCIKKSDVQDLIGT